MPIATADLYDERGDELDSLALQLQDFGGRVSFDGPVRTVRCHRDNALVKQVLATPGAGAVVENGWAGIIVHGAIRDREAIGVLPLGVKALGSNPRKSAKDGVGELDVPVTIARVVFAPGRHVWADSDGVLVER